MICLHRYASSLVLETVALEMYHPELWEEMVALALTATLDVYQQQARDLTTITWDAEPRKDTNKLA